MQVIPVIDLQNGRAVGARRGERSRYLPLANAFCPDGSPTTLLASYRSLFAFPTVYVAALDAITGRCGNSPRELGAVVDLSASQPGIEIWLDAGFRSARQVSAWEHQAGFRCVVGSETLQMPAMPEGTESAALSLDFKDGAMLGPAVLVERPHQWPDIVIVMCLDRVGTNAGPDFARTGSVAAAADGRRIIAAGGIRDGADLVELSALGVDGALLASALQNGRIGADELHRLAAAD